jgi:hypothetical protein
VNNVLDQIDARVIPPEHPAVRRLEQVFGPHTFFLADEGLHVVERGETESPEDDSAYVVKVAAWADAEKTSLEPQPAEIAKPITIGAKDAGDSGEDSGAAPSQDSDAAAGKSGTTSRARRAKH